MYYTSVVSVSVSLLDLNPSRSSSSLSTKTAFNLAAIRQNYQMLPSKELNILLPYVTKFQELIAKRTMTD
ncbi:hypothetical protein Q5P01_024571 [Channa striata]|uniref:Uncharacterized protein n=1 Tax=Channa striata TaxID=64152 RepID=A0AA88LJQ4_CHASR|nr:hypothetical protein Q5P01_024571 [Channa striata]